MKTYIGESPGRLIVEERKRNSSGALIGHLNINSIQNNFEELKMLNNSLRAQKAYWYRKSEELKSKPSELFNAFRPFISTKAKDTNAIYLKFEDGGVEKVQNVVAELLAGHFSPF